MAKHNKAETGPDASIVIPVFNESRSIAEVIDGLSALDGNYEIVAVNDGSTDETGKILDGFSCVTVVHHAANRGYGASLKSGIRLASSRIVVTFDADGQHNPRDVPRLLKEIDNCDMVVGTRTNAFHSPLWRTPGRTLLSLLANAWTGSKIPDLNSGLRAFYRKYATRYESILPEGFSFSTTMTLAMLKEGHAIKYVPILARRRAGQSTLRFSNGSVAFLGILRLMMLFHLSGKRANFERQRFDGSGGRQAHDAPPAKRPRDPTL